MDENIRWHMERADDLMRNSEVNAAGAIDNSEGRLRVTAAQTMAIQARNHIEMAHLILALTPVNVQAKP